MTLLAMLTKRRTDNLKGLGHTLTLEALVRSPGLHQRAVDGEAPARQQRLDFGMVQQLRHERGEQLAVLQFGTGLRKCRRVLDRIIRPPRKPAVEQIESNCSTS